MASDCYNTGVCATSHRHADADADASADSYSKATTYQHVCADKYISTDGHTNGDCTSDADSYDSHFHSNKSNPNPGAYTN